MKAIISARLGIPSVKVKILRKFWGHTFKKWIIVCKVTSKKHTLYKQGKELQVTFDDLYLKEGTMRGCHGKLYWEGKPNFDEIPLA